MINLGLFYQSGYRIEACFYALKKFREFYKKSPVALYEDNSNILKPIAKKFNCEYRITEKKGRNEKDSGRPAFNLETTLSWIDRVYEACTTTLSDVEWVMNFEDDVWFKAPLSKNPPHDLTGIVGIGAHDEFYKYLNAKRPGCFGCGGSIFNKNKFLIAYEKSKSIDWNFMDNLSTNGGKSEFPKPSEWVDSALTLIFLYAGMSVNEWEELDCYQNPNCTHKNDRSNWLGSMKKLESYQKNKANVIHCWKPYYFPTEAEKEFVRKELEPFT